MGYLDVFSKRGLLTTLRHGKDLWLEPEELVSDDILRIAREHKDELIAEIKASSENADSTSPEIAPEYNFLWVATDLSSFEEYDPRYGYEIGRDPVYRMLDGAYYAWLRHQMENASKAHQDNRLADEDYAVLRDRFNVVHEWAITHIGEDALRQAMRTTNIKRYVPPCDATIDAYYQTWAEAQKANVDTQKANQAKVSQQCRSPDADKLGHLLTTQGYAAIKSSIIDDIVIFLRDDGVSVPAKWADKVRFTIDELKLMIGSPVESVKQIYDVKQIFGGKVAPPDYSDSTFPVQHKQNITHPGSKLQRNQHPGISQQLMFEGEVKASA